MLKNTKFLMRNKDSNYIIIDNENYKKEAVFIYKVFLVKNAGMLNPDEFEHYIDSLSRLFKNNSKDFMSILSTKESSAVDYVNNIQKLLVKAKETKEKVKRLILLSQVDLIMNKIGEHKNYFYIKISDVYYSENELQNFYVQKITPFLRLIHSYHYTQELIGEELIGFFNENYLTSSKNKIFINETNINKVFNKKKKD